MKSNTVRASALAAALLGACALISTSANATERVIGKWTQDGTSAVPAAYCNPNCHPDQGNTITIQTYYPDNLEFHGKPVYLKNFAANCVSVVGDLCVFDHVSSLSDDPAQHRMTIQFWSHSGPVAVQLTADEVVDDDQH